MPAKGPTKSIGTRMELTRFKQGLSVDEIGTRKGIMQFGTLRAMEGNGV